MIGRRDLTRRRLLEWAGAGAATLPLFNIGRPALAAEGDLAAQVAAAKEIVAKAAASEVPWDGPTTGPKAQPGKSVVLISEDQRNGGALGVSEGVAEAAKVIGWKLTVLDGAGVIANRSAAFGQAIALRPDVIIADNDDATEQRTNITKAANAGIKVLGWHSNVKPGPMEGVPLFTNISTDPVVVARVAAALAVMSADGRAGVVVFTDATEKISVMKSNAMAANIKECSGCTVLEVIDTPLASVSTRIPQMTQSLHQRFGKKWTHSLAINDGFFDFMAPALRAAGSAGGGAPRPHKGGGREEAATAGPGGGGPGAAPAAARPSTSRAATVPRRPSSASAAAITSSLRLRSRFGCTDGSSSTRRTALCPERSGAGSSRRPTS